MLEPKLTDARIDLIGHFFNGIAGDGIGIAVPGCVQGDAGMRSV